MKTRIFCLVLVLVMAVSCLAGCFGKKDDGGNGGNGGNGGDGGTQGGGNGGVGTGDTLEKAWWNDITYDTTNLIFQMTDCSNNQELPSGCGRFLAGRDDDDQGQNVDQLVEQRNTDAYATANVTVDYKYYEDIQGNGFSQMFDTIFTEVQAQSSTSPDMYCNFMTDMLVTSLKGSFSNLKTIQHNDTHDGKNNYFDLSDPGYMSDLMGSLTLSPEKIYVIASDYFIDLIRAFFVVPVNVNLYNSIAPGLIDDLNGDGEKDVNDIFEEVKNGDWTYERLAEYADAIYLDNDGNGESIKDRMGFGLGVNGLPAAGLVYTSYVTIINKVDKGNNEFEYFYNEENTELYALTDAIKELVGKKGIMAVDVNDAKEIDVNEDGAALLAIRKQFTSDKMLFGGIILVGSLEYTVYQEMKTKGGFGVVPVPVYDKIDHDEDGDYGDEYLTQIHVVGRAGGISKNTDKFVQCSAFLQYQSSYSTDILNEYYDYNLTYDTAAGVDGNVDMLKYIRQNVRTSFDKLYEDAIGFLAPAGTVLDDATRWHTIICNEEYDCDIRSSYATYWSTKNASLQNLVGQYDSLPG